MNASSMMVQGTAVPYGSIPVVHTVVRMCGYDRAGGTLQGGDISYAKLNHYGDVTICSSLAVFMTTLLSDPFDSGGGSPRLVVRAHHEVSAPAGNSIRTHTLNGRPSISALVHTSACSLGTAFQIQGQSDSTGRIRGFLQSCASCTNSMQNCKQRSILQLGMLPSLLTDIRQWKQVL